MSGFKHQASGKIGSLQKLIRLEHAWMEAVRSRDVAFLDDLLGEEFTLTTGRPGNEVRGRQEYIDITRERYVIEDFQFEDLDVHIYGDAAMVRSRYAQRGSMDG